MSDNITTVRAIYEAFGRGDIPAVLEYLDDDVSWDEGAIDHGVPYLRERTGRTEVADFFAALAGNLALTHFEPLEFCGAGDLVAVPVRYAGYVVDGAELPMGTEVHLWRLGGDGKVVSMNHHLDVTPHVRGFAGRAATLAGRTLSVLGDEVQVDYAGGAMEVFEVSGDEGSGPPPHAHPWDEVFIGVDGEVEVLEGETSTRCGAGDLIVVPAGTLHTYRVVSPRATFRAITSGHRASLFFADLATNTPGGPPTPDTLPLVIDIARRNGLSSPLFA